MQDHEANDARDKKRARDFTAPSVTRGKNECRNINNLTSTMQCDVGNAKSQSASELPQRAWLVAAEVLRWKSESMEVSSKLIKGAADDVFFEGMPATRLSDQKRVFLTIGLKLGLYSTE